jgi:ribosomal protein S18 acetylase RimI-like enzyme
VKILGGGTPRMHPRLHELDAHGFLDRLDLLINIYSTAMRPPPDQLFGRRAIMERHATYPDFRAIVVEYGGQLVAFCYGFHGVPGQWWHDVVRRALDGALGEERSHEWLADPFEIAEVHVLPAYQGRGVGRRMVTALCADRPEHTVVLSTFDQKSPARHLYRSLGLQDLITGFLFPGGGPAYAVMGATLPLPVGTPVSSRE